MRKSLLLFVIVVSVLISFCGNAAYCGNVYAKWRQGPDKSDGFFPIAVWLQNPRNAMRYEVLGSKRRLICRDGTFTDRFSAWDVNLYKLTRANARREKP